MDSDRTRELEDLIRELEAFSYSVSHDLRAPLRHIEGYATLLHRRLAESDPESVRYVEKILGSSRHALRLVTALLALAKASRAELHFGPVELDALVKETIEECITEAWGRRIVPVVTPMPPVIGDRTLLKQVFLNLISNAIKFTRGRDEARIEIGAGRGDVGEAVVYVRDNGVGFDPREAGKLFRAFHRLHAQEDFEGTGIGLASVRRIVIRHGGRIWAESAPGNGATFYIALRTPAGDSA